MQSPPTTSAKPPLRERFNALLAEWGLLLLVVYFSIFGIVLAGFTLSIKLGFGVQSGVGFWGTLGAAYVATQLTKPLRIGATIVITPALGAVLKRFRRSPPDSEALAPGAPGAALDPGQGAVGPSAAPLDDTPSGSR